MEKKCSYCGRTRHYLKHQCPGCGASAPQRSGGSSPSFDPKKTAVPRTEAR